MQNLEALLRDFQKAKADYQTFVTKDLPRIIGVEAVKQIHENFKSEQYDSGNGITKWPARKAATNKAYDAGRIANAKTGKLSKYRKGKNSTYKGSVYSSSKPLLRQTLALYNSIAFQVRGTSVFIGTNTNIVPYSRPHNEGLNHEPMRKFMPTAAEGGNVKISSTVGKRIKYETDKIMKTFKK